MSKHDPRFNVLTTGGKEKRVIALSSYNLVKVSCPLTVPFEISEKSWKTPEEIHFEKYIFAKKIFEKNVDENFSWIQWTTL